MINKQLVLNYYWRIKWGFRKYYKFLKSKVISTNKAKYFESQPTDSEIIISPGEKYELTITSHSTKKGCWNYSRGIVKNLSNNQIIADVKRNYSDFIYAWAENHKNGHDYLICGENYQGQTIIELDTGKRKDHLPINAFNGGGFCWSNIKPSPDQSKLAVVGCYWGAPYDLVFFDFSKPLSLPFKELSVYDAPSDFIWIDNNSGEAVVTKEIRISDGKLMNDLEDEEQLKAYEKHDSKEIQEHSIIKAIK